METQNRTEKSPAEIKKPVGKMTDSIKARSRTKTSVKNAETASSRKKGRAEFYHFDNETFMRQHEHWSSDRDNMLLKLMLWSTEFSGRVPKHWGETIAGAPWHAIVDDIKSSPDTLNSAQIEAALAYPIWHVPVELGQRRLLDDHQLILLAVMSPASVREIAESQRKRGANEETLILAREIARRRLTELAMRDSI